VTVPDVSSTNEIRAGGLRLSAIVPNYNHAALIGECIRALAGQVPAADEIIVVDDGSSDDSIAVLERLSDEISSLRMISLAKNQGVMPALNRGLAEARGDYVYFGAADDVTLPGLFARMLEAMERFPHAAFACGEAIVVDTSTGEAGYRPPVRPANGLTFFSPEAVARSFRRIDNWMLTGTAIIHRDAIVEAGGFNTALGGFADGYVLRQLALRRGCCFAPHVGLIWRVSAGGVSRAQAASPTETLATLKLALDGMSADPVFPRWYLPLFERRWRFAVSRLAVRANPMNREVLERVGARGAVGRVVLACAASFGGRLGRIAALAWLAIRERPTSLVGIVATWLSRWPLKAAQSLRATARN
jgi:glycosyltransferase involved in cell wall biosynthesis